jgi:hypothetical protein
MGRSQAVAYGEEARCNLGAVAPRRDPKAHSASPVGQNRAAELRFAADKGPRKVVLTVNV